MTRTALCLLVSSLWTGVAAGAAEAPARPRARELGLRIGALEPGPLNAITDVPGVRVGHTTLVSGDSVRTGVTAILPHDGNLFQEKVAAAVYVFNAFGKLVGATQVQELGQLETPILLTNTLSVWDAAAALAEWMLARPGNEGVRSINPLVGETNDGWLNDIRGRHVRAAHVRQALEGARGGAVEEGSIGAGTGTVAFGWKGGIGTSSRRLAQERGGYTLGVLVQSNFGGALTVDGYPVWRVLQPPGAPPAPAPAARKPDAGSGSCMIVVATDAPLESRDLKRLAGRAVFGLARTGSSFSHGSGDFAIAFTTSGERRVRFGEREPRARAVLPSEAVSPLFQAALEATEEAVYNSLLRATSVTSRGRTVEALPLDRLRPILDRYRPR
jgi:D-aminopeptidase